MQNKKSKRFTILDIIIIVLLVFVLIATVPDKIDGASISRKHATLPYAIRGTSAVYDGKSAYIFGGEIIYRGNSTNYDKIIRYNPSTDEISVTTAQLPKGVSDTISVWDGKNIYVFGGWTGVKDPNTGTLFSDLILRYNPKNDTIEIMNQRLPSEWHGCGGIWDGNDIYLFWYNTTRYDLEVLKYNTSTDRITTMLGSYPIRYPTIIWNGKEVYTFGGIYNGAYTNKILKYNITADEFVELSATLPIPQVDSSAIFDGKNIYLFGGHTNGPLMEIIKFSTDTYDAQIVNTALPTRRDSTSAIWDGKNAYVFGGDSCEEGSNEQRSCADIVRFNPEEDPILSVYVTFEHYYAVEGINNLTISVKNGGYAVPDVNITIKSNFKSLFANCDGKTDINGTFKTNLSIKSINEINSIWVCVNVWKSGYVNGSTNRTIEPMFIMHEGAGLSLPNGVELCAIILSIAMIIIIISVIILQSKRKRI